MTEDEHPVSAPTDRWFFSATCHPPLTRRQVLVVGGVLLATASLGRGARALATSHADGTAIVQRYVTSTDDPWVVAHGLRAMGHGFEIHGKRRAVDFLLEDVLVTIPANGQTVLGFPSEVEVHANSFLKTMLEAGTPVDYAFTHGGRRRTVHDVVEGARALLRPALVSSVPNALPWSIIALTRTTTPLRRQWTNAWDEPVDLDALVESALGLLEQASLPIAAAMREGRPLTAQAPVHALTCGGTHMVYALLTAMNAGYTGKDRRERVRRQVDLLVWRLGADLDLIERFYRGRQGVALLAWYELDTKLKLLSHAEECLAFASLHKVVRLTPDQQARRRTAVATLRQMLGDLETRNLDEAKRLDRELYNQLVGDSCHARHGLTLA